MEVLDIHHINNRPADITEPTSLKKSEKQLNSTKIIKTSHADDEGYSPRITLMSTPLSKEDLNSKEMSVDIESVSKSLDELSIQSEIISTKFSEGIKFNDLIKEVKSGFQSRYKEIESLISNQRASSPSKVQPVNETASLATLKRLLFEFYKVVWALKVKLSKAIGDTKGAHLPQSLKIMTRKKKLLLLSITLKESWNATLLQVALMIAEKSSDTSNLVTKHIHQLAVATGAPDWKELTLDDAKILYIQGDKYLLGYGLTQSFDMAFKRYTSAAERGCPEAENMLGMIYENGLGKKKDMLQAIKWYQSAAEEGKNCLDALNSLGRIYQNGIGCKIDLEQARIYYTKAAKLGHLDAMVNLAYQLDHGLGAELDPKTALKWYEAAANKDYAKAQNALGSCYYKGVGGIYEPDLEKAVANFRKAAHQGYPPAINNLGICYEEGRGVAKDLGIAKQLYKESAASMHPSAVNNYGFMELIECHYDEAIRHFHIGMSLGNADSAFNLGTLYENGCQELSPGGQIEIILKQDHESAIKYYKFASEQNHVPAYLRLANIYLTGPEHLQDRVEGYLVLLKAAEQGSAEAQNQVGQLVELGIVHEEMESSPIRTSPGLRASPTSKSPYITQPNFQQNKRRINYGPDAHEARMWYSRAIEKGHIGAIYNLGCLYEIGNGVEKDLDKAVKLYKEAALNGHEEAQDRLQELTDIGLVPQY